MCIRCPADIFAIGRQPQTNPGLVDRYLFELDWKGESLISINRNTEFAGDSIAANDGREVSSGLPSTARTMF